MLKARIIPILTFNGFGLVKTKQFSNPRMVGNAVQAARVYNSRGVDELVFLDITASEQGRKMNLKLVSDVIKECYMPVAIGGNITSIDDINQLLKIGADKVVIKTQALTNRTFIQQAVNFFGSQCITIALDVTKVKEKYLIFNKLGLELEVKDFIAQMNDCKVGELILNNVDADGMLNGFNTEMVNYVMALTTIPVIAVGGGGELSHFSALFSQTPIMAVGAASIFHFTQYTPLDIKNELATINIPVRV